MIKNLQISNGQLIVAVLISVVTVALSMVPFFYGQIASKESYYTGRTLNSRYDLYTYLSWVEQAREGKFFFKELYTTEDQPNVFFHPIFYLMGTVGRFTQLSNLYVYEVAKGIISTGFLLITFIFISHFLSTSYSRFLAFVLVCSSSGLEFIYGLQNYSLWFYEFNTFTDITNTLLDPLSLGLILGIFYLALNYFNERNYWAILLTALLVNILGIIHTYDLVLVFSLILVYGIWSLYFYKKKNFLFNSLILLITAILSVLWQIHVLGSNSALGIWAFIQSNVHSSSPWVVFIQYGLVLVLALCGLIVLYFEDIKDKSFLFTWFIVGAVLIYSPIFSNYQRKFGIGYHIVLCMLAALTIEWVFAQITIQRKLWKWLGTTVLICYLAITNAYSIFLTAKYLYQDNPKPYFINRSEYSAMKWLKDNGNKNLSVLAGYENSNLIPGLTGMAVYCGHYDQTTNTDLKYDIAIGELSSKVMFKDPMPNFIKESKIGYIMIDEEVRDNSGELDLTKRPYLKMVYDNLDVQIYEIDQKLLD